MNGPDVSELINFQWRISVLLDTIVLSEVLLLMGSIQSGTSRKDNFCRVIVRHGGSKFQVTAHIRPFNRLCFPFGIKKKVTWGTRLHTRTT